MSPCGNRGERLALGLRGSGLSGTWRRSDGDSLRVRDSGMSSVAVPRGGGVAGRSPPILFLVRAGRLEVGPRGPSPAD